MYQTEFSKTEKVDSARKSVKRIDMFEQIQNATFESEEDEKGVDKVRKDTEEAYEFDFSERSGSSRNQLHAEMDHVRSILKHKLQESQAPSIERINLSELSNRDGR